MPPVAERIILAMSDARRKLIADIREQIADPKVQESLSKPYSKVSKTIVLRVL